MITFASFSNGNKIENTQSDGLHGSGKYEQEKVWINETYSNPRGSRDGIRTDRLHTEQQTCRFGQAGGRGTARGTGRSK